MAQRAHSVDREQVLGFRLGSHNLATRLPPGSLLPAAGACGVQNTPPGSAALALHARIAELTPADIDRAVAVDKTLLQLWSLRGSPYLFPTSDAAVFTLGALPADEESLRYFIRGAAAALDQIGIGTTEVVERTAAALRDALDGRALTKQQLGIELARRVAQGLTARQLVAWQAPSWYAPDQRLGEAIVRFALDPIALQGLFCVAPRRGNAAQLIRTDEWLGAPLPHVNRAQACAELVRRYLHCYGPSTVQHFAAWAGIAPAQATQAWRLVEHELVAVTYDRRTTWLHQHDVERLESPQPPMGIRLLPPHDPYLLLRDRATLIPDTELHRHIWRYAGNPGVVLADGQVVAIWRSRTQGKRLKLAVEVLTTVGQPMRSAIEAEAASLAPYRECVSAEVRFACATHE